MFNTDSLRLGPGAGRETGQSDNRAGVYTMICFRFTLDARGSFPTRLTTLGKVHDQIGGRARLLYRRRVPVGRIRLLSLERIRQLIQRWPGSNLPVSQNCQRTVLRWWLRKTAVFWRDRRGLNHTEQRCIRQRSRYC